MYHTHPDVRLNPAICMGPYVTLRQREGGKWLWRTEPEIIDLPSFLEDFVHMNSGLILREMYEFRTALN